MSGISLLIFLNLYPVTDAFGIGHNGGNVFLIPPDILFPLSCSCENSGVLRILVRQGFEPREDGPPKCLWNPLIHLEMRSFLRRHDAFREIQTHFGREVLTSSSVNLQS